MRGAWGIEGRGGNGLMESLRKSLRVCDTQGAGFSKCRYCELTLIDVRGGRGGMERRGREGLWESLRIL